MTAAPQFIHLRTHSAYSLAEGALPVKKLVKLAAKLEMPALAITDRNNLFGALDFSQTMAGAGIQPIIGCTVSFAFRNLHEETPNGRPGKTAAAAAKPALASPRQGDLVLIARNEGGYQNLLAIVSRSYLDNGGYDEPIVHCDLLQQHADGLIVLTGGPDGVVDRALRDGQGERARQMLERLVAIVPDGVYVELQRHGLESEEKVELPLVELAYDLDLPLVATNQCFFPERDDFAAHDALVCIAEGSYVVVEERRRLTPEHYFKSAAEMAELFADLPEALASTIEIARRCSYRPLLRKPILPRFGGSDTIAPAEQERIEADELVRQAKDGLQQRLDVGGTAKGVSVEEYWKRLDFELGVIVQMKFPGYFLIVSDFIKWAKTHGIPVGPGRGSGAGSLVAWALTITDLDPIRFGLLFERFLNPERVSMPDFDIDFCQDRRDEVIGYVQDKYGKERVAQIITFGKLQARAVMRDVGRVLQMPYGQVDRLCKLVPNNPSNPITLAEALKVEPKLQEAADEEDVVAHMLEIAQNLEGLYRHASTHAAGVVIGDRPLDLLVPLYRDPRSPLPVTQFNMKWVEPAGLVKFDFLGLKTLTVIQKALEFIRRGGGHVDFTGDPLDDKPTYELLARGDTVGVFQLESTGMREALKQLKPDRFEDIIAMVSLYRPGPMDNIPTYINRKFGREEPVYLDPKIKPILEETYGVIIYQEQVMQIAQVLAGYSLGQADLLRRAMGKKIKEEMDKQRPPFVEGAVARGCNEKTAGTIFDLLEKFASYGFNKSHAAAYALLAYQTAYLKANHPVEFMAAIMTLDQGNTDKIKLFFEETRLMGVAMRPPSINRSTNEFVPEAGGIRYSLAALKNVGEQAIKEMVRERNEHGPFGSVGELAQRLDPKSFNKRTIETLAGAGAFDELGLTRAEAHDNADLILGHANRVRHEAASGQSSLFGSGDAKAAPELKLREVAGWAPMDILEKEQGAIGFYLSGHPLDEYRDALAQLKVETYAEFIERVEATREGRPAETKPLAEADLIPEPESDPDGDPDAETRPPAQPQPSVQPQPQRTNVLSLDEHVRQNRAKQAQQAQAQKRDWRQERRRESGLSGTLAGVVTHLQERRSKSGNKFAFAGFSDLSAQFEMVLFSDTLEAQRDTLQAGEVVLLRVSGEYQEDQLRLRLLAAEPLDKAVGRISRGGVQLTIDKATPLAAIAAKLNGAGSGKTRLVLRLDSLARDVVITIPRGIDPSPRQTGELRVLPGVRDLKEI
jgi:DNA polymerase-3 subunit alpha